jgi:hypothetical protein
MKKKQFGIPDRRFSIGCRKASVKIITTRALRQKKKTGHVDRGLLCFKNRYIYI